MVEDVLRLLPPILAAIAAGAILGIDREMRGRPAGLRTHILVCVASAGLMLAPSHQQMWLDPTRAASEAVLDPTRMGQGIMTGIGFLGAGVIFRNGFTVHGLTTAAALWMAAGIGILFGLEFYAAGWLTTAVGALVLVALHWVDYRLPGDKLADTVIRYARGKELDVTALQARLESTGCTVREQGYRLLDGGLAVEQAVILKVRGRLDAFALGQAIQAIDGVVGLDIKPR
jgi:putative Mg2+ transporter-C (MgtC) family protein